jgi:hypothetical protein
MPDEQPQHVAFLATPQAVAIGQAVYERIISGACTNVEAELNAAYGFTTR